MKKSSKPKKTVISESTQAYLQRITKEAPEISSLRVKCGDGYRVVRPGRSVY